MYPRVEILELSDIQKNTWDDFLKKNPDQATVFHTQEWMRTLHEAFGYEPKYLAYRENDYTFNAVMPLMIDTRFGIQNYFSMPLDTYGGVVGDLNYEPAIIHALAHLPGIGMRYFVDYYGREDPRDFEVVPQSTELMDISQDVNAIWDQLHKDNRTAIKSAMKRGVKTKLHGNPDILDRVSPGLINAISYYMVPSGLCEPVVAEVDNTRVAASLFFVYGNMAMYWANTTLTLGRDTNANYLLLWDTILYAKGLGCKVFNFGASPEGADGLIAFKKSWGTRTHTYMKYQKVPFALRPILAVKEAIHG